VGVRELLVDAGRLGVALDDVGDQGGAAALSGLGLTGPGLYVRAPDRGEQRVGGLRGTKVLAAGFLPGDDRAGGAGGERQVALAVALAGDVQGAQQRAFAARQEV